MLNTGKVLSAEYKPRAGQVLGTGRRPSAGHVVTKALCGEPTEIHAPRFISHMHGWAEPEVVKPPPGYSSPPPHVGKNYEHLYGVLYAPEASHNSLSSN